MIRSWFCVLEEISCPLISTLLKGLPSVFTSADAFKMGPGEYHSLRELCSFQSPILDLTQTGAQGLSYFQSFFWGGS